MMQFINNTINLPDTVATITIPVKDIPAIQTAIISTSIQGAIEFFIIGLVLAFGFSYFYFLIWKKANGM
jgi:hypothetical protein